MMPNVKTSTHDYPKENDLATAGDTTEAVNRSEDRAKELFNLGKRHYYCHNYEEAVEALSESCEIFCELYGDLDYRCAEVYLYYGKSLAEHERTTQQLINVSDKQNPKKEDASDENDEDSEEDEDEENEATESSDEPVERADSPNKNTTGANNGDTTNSVDTATSTSSTVCNNGQAPIVSEAVSTSAVDQTSDEGQTGSQTANNDATAAWEVLDTARIIYERHLDELCALQTPESREQMKFDTLRLADIRMTLGEVCVLDEKYADGIQEFSYARHLLASVCDPDDRRVAEAYFQIGLAHELNKELPLAIENMDLALDLLRSRHSNAQLALQRHLKDSGTSSEPDAEQSKMEMVTEVKELSDVLAQVEQRIGDLIEAAKTAADVTRDLKELTVVPTHSKPLEERSSSVQLSPAAADVSHLVRKPLKRTSPLAEHVTCDKRAKVETPKNDLATSSVNDIKKENGTAK